MSAIYEAMSPGGHEAYATSIFSKIKTYLDSNYLKLSGGTMTGRLTTTKPVNQIITGTGIAAQDKGSGVSPRYFPVKWTFNTGNTATDGDIVTIKIPVAGHSYGVYMSIDNGTTYYPIVCAGTSRLTSHFQINNYITLVFEPSGSAASMYPLNGGDARVTVTGGVWRVINFYYTDSNTIPSAYCDTAAATAAKTASCTNYVATSKSYLHVLIRYANTSKTALTFNVNSQGAKPIYINGSASSASNYTLPAGTYFVYYDGTNYYFRTDGKITGDITTYTGALTSSQVTSALGFTPTANTGTITSVKTTAGAHTAINVSSGAANFNVPTKTSHLTNDSGFVTTDTKNTAGSTDTSSKIFLIGATSQAANPQTYSHDTAYVGTDGCLYSGGTKVLTAHQDISGKADKSATVSNIAWSNNKLTKTINGTTSDVVSASDILDNLTSSQVTSALGFTPTANTGTITSVKTTAGTHTAINVTSGAANFNVPTKTSHLTNDSGFVTTDTKVTQTATDASSNAEYEILFSETADNTTRTEGARKTSQFTFNPQTNQATAGHFTAETSSPSGNKTATLLDHDVQLGGTSNTWDGTNTSLKQSLSNLIFHNTYTLSSDANAFAKTAFKTNEHNLVSATGNGFVCIPFNGGDGWWYVVFVNANTWAKLPNVVNRPINIYYQPL